MSKYIDKAKHLYTVKGYRVETPVDLFNQVEIDEGTLLIVDPEFIKEVEELAGPEGISQVGDLGHWISPSGLYVISEWEVLYDE